MKYSIRVTARLKEKCSKDVIFFLLADTSYGSCCVDLVAAEHYQADSIIHFGHSCLSLVDKLPVFLVFEKYPLDLNHVENEINKIQKELGNSKLIILYDVGYYYLYNEMVSKFSNNPSIFMSNINTNINKNENQQEELTRNVLFSRNLPDDLKTESYSFYYIGSNEKFIHPFLFYFNKCKFYNFDPNKNVTELITKTSKELMKRYYLIEKARDAKIFGILIGTMSVANYNEAVDHVSLLLKKAKKRFYSFLIGKLNCPKLNNFMEVDMYVLISCNENCLVNSKELNKPVITIYELEIAYNCARLWGEEFICDYRQLLEGKEHYIPIELSDKEADVSLINGEMRLLADKKNSKLDSALVNRNDTLSMMHYEGAGKHLMSSLIL